MATKALEELCQIEQIKRLKISSENLSDKGNFVLANKLEVENGKLIHLDTSSYLIEGIEEEKWLSSSIDREDIVIFINKKKIQIGINTGKSFCSNKSSLIRLRCNKELASPLFINYLLEHKKEELENLFDGNIDHFFEDLKPFKLDIPDLQKQSKIVSSLQQFYELIDVLKRQLEIREQQFQIFQEKLFSPNPS